MKKTITGYLLTNLIVATLATSSAMSQSPFFQAVTNLNPVAYWPLQETVQPPVADVETNLGSLGAVANAYYSSTNVYKSQSGAVADAADSYAYCNGSNGCFLAVPTTDLRTSVPVGPFTVEAWVNPANTSGFIGMVSQSGANPGGLNGSTYRGGWVLSQNYFAYQDSSSLRGWSFHVYNGQGAGNGNPQGGAEAGVPYNYSVGTWYYLAAVFDGTNCVLFVNGTNVSSQNAGYTIPMTGSYVPDTWDPLCIGCGRGLNANRFTGGMDEVAIYTNALTAAQVQAHYNAANISYFATVMGDKPYMYWRMDAPNYTAPDVIAYPVAADYGSDASLGGLYLSGATPGVAGPSYSGLGSPSYACAFNGVGTDSTNVISDYTNGILYATNIIVNTGILITNLPSSLNLTTNFNVTAMCWFKANPADSRYQGLFGHGNGSWKLSLNTDGHIRWTPGAGGDFESAGAYDDGNWHFVVGVYTNSGVAASPAGVLATNYIYVDGVLDNWQLVTNTTASGNTINALLGGVGDYFYSGNNNSYNQRYFSGSLAQAAYFTNALTAGQVVNLYTNAGATVPPPTITAQPYPYPSVRSVVGGPGVYIYEAVVAYGGTPTLGYQWYYNSRSNYAGATALVDDIVHYTNSTTFQVTITNLTGSDSGYYFCVVSNNYGATTSAIVNVQVYTAPVITAQNPSGLFTLFTGQNPSLSVTASGAAGLTYQWFTNGVADTTAGTNSSYSSPAAQVQSGEAFQCIVTNAYGSATSQVATLTLQPLPAAVASSAYATNVLALNPTVYFPMHESAPAVAADIETNYGTLGAVGNGTYADWNVNGGFPDDQVILHQVSGAVVGDTDSAKEFNFHGTTNSYLLVPHTSPGTTLTVPFTIEAWVWGTGSGFGDIVSEDGTKLNTGNANNTYGVRLSWGGNIQVYVGTYAGPASSSTLSYFQWHHVALTCDTNNGTTNYILYVDGSSVSSKTGSGFIPDSWDPLTIGNGLWNASGVTRAAPNLAIDEVAIYNTNLDATTIATHHNDGLNGAPGQYVADVTSLNPVLYYRMDAPVYNLPDSSTWPAMTNYGTAAINGVYTPGLAPGSVAGPNNGAGSFATTLSGDNAAPMNGLSTYAAAYAPNTFNVVGATTPLSFSMWFKSNPSDARYQTLISQGPGWQMAQQVNGTLQFYLGNGFVNTTNVYNDGNWHQVVVTYSTNVGNIYIDGVLNGSGTSSALTNPPPTTAYSMCIGCDPRFTGANQASGAGRQYAGNICEVAFWNGTALTSSQVATLYQASGMVPIITSQPVSANVNARTAFTNTVAGFGPGTLTYQWYRDGQPLPIGGQTNLTFGATNASLVLSPVKTNDASADYYVVVANQYGSITSSVVALTVYGPPAFTSEPIDVTQTNNIFLFAGATPTFKVATIGAQPIYCQWFTNGVAATANSPALTNYTLPPVQLSAAINLSCVASNFVDKVTSTPITITGQADPTAPYPVAVLMDSPAGYWRLNEPDDMLGDGNAGALAGDRWGGNNGIYTNTDLGQPGYTTNNVPDTDPTETSAQFGFKSFTDGDAYGIGGVDFGSPTNTSAAFSVEAWVNGYQQTKDSGIVSKGYGGGGEQFDLDTGSDGGTPSHAFRFFVRDASGATHGANSFIQPGNTWHHLVGVCDEVNGNVTLYVDGAVAGTSAISPGSGIQASDRAMIIGSRPSSSSSVNDDQFVGLVDDVAVYNYALSASQVGAHYAAAGVPPNFTQVPPTNVTVDGFGFLTIPAAAVGTPVIGYQWHDMNGGTNVAVSVTNGPVLNATLTVSNVPLTWNGDTLELTVTNAYGSTNVFVTLTVYTNAPQITADLQPQVVIASGKSYTYSISVVGPQPYGYQWYNGATPIIGQTNSTYSLIAGSPGSTTYSVVVSNIFGPSTSTISTFTSVAPPSGYGYATSVLGLSPVGYWPLQETSAPAAVAMETNYGSLGSLGNAYYAITNANPVAVTFSQGGALNNSGDYDPAVFFSGYSSTGSAGATNLQSYAFVPHITSALTLIPPLTMECWVFANGVGTEFADMFGEGGGTGLNAANGGGNFGGIRLSYGGNNGGGPNLQLYVANGSGTTRNDVATPANSLPIGQWHHCVATYDGTNTCLYVDGVELVTNSTVLSGANTLNPDTWSPFTIGGAFWQNNGPGRAIYATLDEVAVYTNVLTADRVQAHYNAGTTFSGSNYVSAIKADKPLLYYRMDSAGYTNPPASLYPEAVNFGSTPVNGFYLPGIVPGGVAGPTNSVLGTNSILAAPINGILSCVDAGSDPSFDPSGTQPFTAMVWFKGYPCDDRAQTIMGHGVTNWAMNLDGTTGRVVWNLYNGGQITSANILNDGNWHFVAGVYDGTSSYLYVDGQLDGSAAVTGGLAAEPSAHLYLGGDSDFPIVGSNQRYFGGAIAQAALFDSALTGSQIQALYTGSVNPTISIAPSGSNLVITYSGSLLSSTNVAGQYAPVPGAPFAASPTTYTVSPTGAQEFYRTSSQ